MEPTSLIDDAEFWLPPEFLTDEDFLLEKENKGGGPIDDCLFQKRHGFESGFEENFLPGLTSQMVQSTLEHDFAGGFFGNHAFPAGNDYKALGTARSSLGGAGIGCGCRNQLPNQNRQSTAWDLYCAAAEEMARMNINDEPYSYNNHSGRGLVDLSRKHPLAAAKNPNNGSDYYVHQSLRYQKQQAIQFQQLKQQQQLMKHHRQLVQQGRGSRVNNNNKSVAPVDLSSSAWSNQQPRRDGSGMRAVFIGKRGSTGTGVFLPRRVNHTSSPATAEIREKPTFATVLVPARVAQVLNLDESVVQPVVRSSASLYDASWRQRSNNGNFSSQMKMEQPVNEPRLPSDWAY